jgi:hypothetical protein
MRIRLTSVGLAGRRLIIDDSGSVPFAWGYDATIDEYPVVVDVATSELVANPMILAVRAARRLFMRFGWTAEQSVLLGSLTRFRKST